MTAGTSPLSAEQGRCLIRAARAALNEKFGRTTPEEPQPDDAALQSRSGIFVTLKIGERLRGCIGTLVGREPLIEGAQSYALHAGFADPRFHPLAEEELDQVRIEVSVLTTPELLSYSSPADLIRILRPHVDGVTIRKGFYSATFLPQVWEQLPDPQEFLGHLCLKAGLRADAWKSGMLEVETYQVQYFEE